MTEQRSHRYVRRWEDVYDDPGMAGRVRSWARRRALDVLARWPREEPGRQLRCLNCHWVFDDQKSGFREIMASLQQRAEFVDTETCLRM
ncbi:MAG: hypothetical protein ABEL76_10425, partial [Bradymonadaceae bacterium]